jgi:hypothetical protein
VKILLDVAKESSDWFPPLKSALGGVNALIKHYEVLVEWMDAVAQLTRTLAAIRRCQGEDRRILNPSWTGSNKTLPRQRSTETKRRRATQRIDQVRSPIARHAHPCQRPSQRIGRDREAIAGIAGKGTAARFVDKGEDSGEVARLVERLREAITHYQVSENFDRVEYYSHRRTDIATASDLRPNHQPHCEDFPVCLHPFYTDDRSFHQVFFRYPLETSRGDAVQ